MTSTAGAFPVGAFPLTGADARLEGEAAGDEAGHALAFIRDVNGDGRDEILIGARWHDATGLNAGAAYLLYGRATWTGTVGLGAADAKLVGETFGDQAGFSVADAGDFDGDGIRDLAVGAVNAESAVPASGAVYIVRGGHALSGTIYLSQAHVKILGDEAVQGVGYSIAGAGDVTGDGRDDLVVGVRYYSKSATFGGAAYIVAGLPGLAGTFSVENLAYARLLGEGPFHYMGTSVAGVGDANGDGHRDFLVGASSDTEAGVPGVPLAGGAGAAYLVLGPVRAGADLTASVKFLGEGLGDRAGWSVAGAGDVNADGVDDLLIGAKSDQAKGANTGAAYLVLGRSTWPASFPLGQADVKLVGGEQGDRAGTSVAAAGDLNGDGFDDLVIGAPHQDDNAFAALAAATPSLTGRAYVVFGAAVLPPVIALEQADARLGGESGLDLAGFRVTGGGDADGDGRADVLVGAIGRDAPASNAGAAYLVRG